LVEKSEQEARAGKLEAQYYTRDYLRKREIAKGNNKRKLNSFNSRQSMPKLQNIPALRASLSV
jgi:hypothetical protein